MLDGPGDWEKRKYRFSQKRDYVPIRVRHRSSQVSVTSLPVLYVSPVYTGRKHIAYAASSGRLLEICTLKPYWELRILWLDTGWGNNLPDTCHRHHMRTLFLCSSCYLSLARFGSCRPEATIDHDTVIWGARCAQHVKFESLITASSSPNGHIILWFHVKNTFCQVTQLVQI